ncbi:MAG: nicotinate phosphoribosyltransferase [Candidatus Kapaibacterium sp.]
MTPTNPLVQPLLTDLYQITMAYGYWRSGIHRKPAAFELIFRKNPFGGEYSIFAGLREALAFLESYRFADDDIAYLRSVPALAHVEDDFWRWLAAVDASELTVESMMEGTPAFPRIPLLRVEGPIAVAQLMETTLLNLINFSTLIATNAARMRYVTGDAATLMEFGLRRAQGPDGGMTATRSAVIGGFDSTSNVLAGKLMGIPIAGTHAHAFVQAFMELPDGAFMIRDASGAGRDIRPMLETIIAEDGAETNMGELAAFLAYAQSFPDSTLLLVDTYDTLGSGVPNAIRVFRVLRELGHVPAGIRLDSGDLAYLSREARRMLRDAGFGETKIVASNSINEAVLMELKSHQAEVDAFGVGTNLVTAEGEPALGGVYKLVELDGMPRIKISQEPAKITIPGRKHSYCLSGGDGFYLADVMTLEDEAPPAVGEPFLCRHPFVPGQRVRIVPSAVERLHVTVFAGGKSLIREEGLAEVRERSRQLQKGIRPDHRRALNPTPYKVSLSEGLFDYMYRLWEREAVVRTIQ